MLYVTTKNKHDTNTAHRTLLAQRAPDGGLYLPFHMVSLDDGQLARLGELSFGQCVAETLNKFFACRLTGWDVEFAIGRYPAKTAEIGQRIFVAQTWLNQAWDYTWAEKALARKICEKDDLEKPGIWVRIAIRVAFLTGIFGGLIGQGAVSRENPVDVAVPAGDFSVAMSVWYGRKMGLPIANIICGCIDSPVWDLLHLGTVKTDGDMPDTLEMLICEVLGHGEAVRYSEICAKAGEYSLLPADSEKLRAGMFAGVISVERIASVIPSVYSTNQYIMGPVTALGYSGLLDFRARTGENRTALLLAERSPACDSDFVANSMGITKEALKEKLQ